MPGPVPGPLGAFDVSCNLKLRSHFKELTETIRTLLQNQIFSQNKTLLFTLPYNVCFLQYSSNSQDSASLFST